MPGEVEPPDRRKAVLLVSLILLVTNSAATALHLRSRDATSPHIPPESGIEEPAAGASGDRRTPSGNRPLAMTARQAFLLGKLIDINSASWREISGLPGISDAVARSIVAARERIGGFRGPEDLLSIRGIKAKRLKKILPFLVKFGNK